MIIIVIIFCCLFELVFWTSVATAYQCKLENSLAEANLVYNGCKADLFAGFSQHLLDAEQPRS